MAVAAADSEPDCAIAEATRLALNANEVLVVVDDEVAPRVLSEGDIERHAIHPKRGHDCECRAVTDVFGVFHVVRIAYGSDGIISRLPE